MKSILNVFFTGDKLAATVSVSLSLAKKFNSYIEGRLAFPPELVSPLSVGAAAVLYSDGTENLEEGKAMASHVGDMFRAIISTHGIPSVIPGRVRIALAASWRPELIRDVANGSNYATGFDLIVVEPPSGPRRIMFMDFLWSLVTHCGRPVLLAPSLPVLSCSDRIAILWDQGAETKRLTSAMLPLLSRAKEIVLFCTANEQESATVAHLTDYLSRHEITSRVKGLPWTSVSSVAQLSREANQYGVDLLMMGYSRHGWPYRLFGGR